ncbi:hypothetical protein BACEGG_01951 [Bacteroides eggerthii DSM 20697]|nr:hypothetical protein BACEGG_01951 [Bacteroides eggerthii DSM 20697]
MIFTKNRYAIYLKQYDFHHICSINNSKHILFPPVETKNRNKLFQSLCN